MNSYSLTNTGDALAYLYALATAKQSGEVIFNHQDQNAKVYLNGGQIVWAFASGQEESFQSILVRENQVAKEHLLAGIKKAREDGKRSLEEILLVLGVADKRVRQDIIKRHTAAALAMLQRWAAGSAQYKPLQPLGDSISGMHFSELVDTSALALPKTNPSAAAQNGSPSVRPDKKTKPAQERGSYQPQVKVEQVGSVEDVLDCFRDEISGFIASILIESSTGMPICAISDEDSLDPDVVGAFYRKLSSAAIEALGATGKSDSSGSTLEEILLTSSEDYSLICSLNKGQQLLLILLDKQSNPGMARVVSRRYLEQLESFLN